MVKLRNTLFCKAIAYRNEILWGQFTKLFKTLRIHVSKILRLHDLIKHCRFCSYG